MTSVSQIIALIASVRHAGENAIGGGTSGLGIVNIVGVRREPGSKRNLVRVTLASLNDALETEQQVVDVASPRELVGIIRGAAGQHRLRARLRSRLLSLKAVAFVDEVTEAAIRHVGETVGKVTRRLLAGERIITLSPPFEPEVKLWLAAGRVRSSFEPHEKVRWNSMRLVVREKVFEMYIGVLTGGLLREVIEHPMLPGNLRIRAVYRVGNELELSLRLRSRAVLSTETE